VLFSFDIPTYTHYFSDIVAIKMPNHLYSQ
jgi:hypothetical protein